MTRRTWLLVPGADPAAHEKAARSGADVIVMSKVASPQQVLAHARKIVAAFEKARAAGKERAKAAR